MVSETWAPEINGVAHTLRRLSHELIRHGVTLDVIRPRPAVSMRAETGAAVPVRAELHVPRLGLPGYRDVQIGLATPGRLRRFFQTQRPDVIYLATQGPLGFAARQAALNAGIPVVAGWHTNFDHYCHDYGLAWLASTTRRYLRHFHNGCTLTLAPTQQQVSDLAACGIRRVHHLSRGIDGECFSPAKRDPALRRSWQVGEHQPVALYAGRLAAEKNLTLVQEAFHAMEAARPDMAQVIVGDGPARQQLEDALPNAHFTGFLPQSGLARHYASADIFVFPSLSETWGNVVAEAMASGLCVVAYHHAASAELINTGDNGITVAVEDQPAFINASVSLCQQPARYTRLGRTARLRALEQRWSDIARQLLTYLQHAQESYHASSSSCRIRPS